MCSSYPRGCHGKVDGKKKRDEEGKKKQIFFFFCRRKTLFQIFLNHASNGEAEFDINEAITTQDYYTTDGWGEGEM
jgi:hypothetical protein